MFAIPDFADCLHYTVSRICLHVIRHFTNKSLKLGFQLRLWKALESDHVFSSKPVILYAVV
jgi:hypothetical protein